MLERGLHRRALLKSATAAGLLSLAPGAGRLTTAQDGETIFNFVVISDAPSTIDPGENWNGAGGFVINAHVYDALFRFEGAETATIVPMLAVEAPTVENGGISEDGLQYTIKLKPEATFPDGAPVNAAAVKFSYDRTKELKLGVDFLLDQIVETEAVDETTVRFTIKQPFSPFLNSLGSVFANLIMNPAVVAANATEEDPYAHEYLVTHAAGSGPYLLDSFAPELNQAILVRNLDWWQSWPEGPHIDKVVVQYIQENATARLMLEQGDADYVAGITAEAMDALETMPGIVTFEGLSIAQSYIALNVHVAPFDNVKVRQALAYALNYDAAIEGIWGGGLKMDSVTPPMVGYAPAATGTPTTWRRRRPCWPRSATPTASISSIAVDEVTSRRCSTLQLSRPISQHRRQPHHHADGRQRHVHPASQRRPGAGAAGHVQLHGLGLPRRLPVAGPDLRLAQPAAGLLLQLLVLQQPEDGRDHYPRGDGARSGGAAGGAAGGV